MWLGALLELGVSQRALREVLRALAIDGLRMRVSKVVRKGIASSYVRFEGPARSAHERHYTSIHAVLEKADLDPEVRRRSQRVFESLARVEAGIHGVELEHVHFHELGSCDTFGDIVGVTAALSMLGVERVTSSPVALGSGTVKTEHGLLPLPAPATLALLKGVPTYPAHVEWETVTPTGAALLAEFVQAYGPMPALTPHAQGFGAGNDRKGPMANVLRAVLSEPIAGVGGDSVVVLETNVDDMSPEALPFLLERLMTEGALDASYSPLMMKKGRPGHLLRVIAKPSDRDALARRILVESSAIGVRQIEMSRVVLERESRVVETPFGRIRVKRVCDPEGRRSASPEYEACARAALRHGVPLLEVYRAAERAAEELA